MRKVFRMKFFFYPRWNCERAEAMLEQMEARGFRLEKIKFHWFFFFKSAKPKNTRYLLTYSQPGEDEMWQEEMKIKRDFFGEQITEPRMFAPNVFRICNTDIDLTEFKRRRDGYIKKMLFRRMLYSLAFMLLPLLMFLFGKGIDGYVKSATTETYIFAGVLLLLFLALFLYYLIGAIRISFVKNKKDGAPKIPS